MDSGESWFLEEDFPPRGEDESRSAEKKMGRGQQAEVAPSLSASSAFMWKNAASREEHVVHTT